jgi:aerobic carbon-monoxide dehydrogenase medium subunit
MIAQNFDYSAPATLAEALREIAAGAKPLAGGMSLIPMMKLRLAAPDKLVYIGKLKDLDYIREAPDGIHIGAGSTHHAVEISGLIRGKCPLLAETVAHVGDPLVRNVGTIGGSVAHADPSADYPAALQALDAKIALKSSTGERTVSAADFFVDTFTTALEPGEIVSEVIVPVEGSGVGTSYQKMVQPASGFAIVGVAARIQKTGGKISMARIGVTGLSNRSYRSTAAEQALEGKAGTTSEIQNAAALVPEGVDANSDLHASSEYRKHLAVVYATRAILAALARSA